MFQQQKSYVASEKTWKTPRVPAPWVDFFKHFFYPIKFTESSKQTKIFYPKHFATRWRIAKTCSRSKSCLIKKTYQLLSTYSVYHKQNKALWSSEVNFRNKEEKSAVKEDLLSLFGGRFSEDFLDGNFYALRTALNRESKKYKDKAPEKKWKFFDKLSFLTEELEKADEKVKFDLEDRETLTDFSIRIRPFGTTILRNIVIRT